MANVLTKIPKFRRCVLQNFPFIEEDFDALTDYELLCKVVEYLNKVITSQNAVIDVAESLTTAFNELQSFVANYFANLDVQEEINNKLDQMAEDGTLQEIITAYIQANVAWAFDTVADMKLATNLVNGSYAQTLGYHTLNDKGGALYKIRTINNDDVVDEGSIIAISNNLVAELIVADKLNILNFGYEVESVSYDERTSNVKNITDALRNAISFLIRTETAKGTSGGTIGVQIYFPDDFYYIDESIDLDSAEISLLGNSPAIKRVNYRIGNFRQKILTSVDGAVFDDGKIHLTGLNFENILTTGNNDKLFTNATIQSMRYCDVNNYDIVLKSLGGVATIDSNYFLNCRKYFLDGNTSDAIIVNNYINAAPEQPSTVAFKSSTIGMTLISGNFIDFFKSGIVVTSSFTGARIVSNTFDYINKPLDFGGANGVTISNNTFNHISKDYYARLFYAETDPEATNNWYCITTRSTINNLTITGNNADNIDGFVNIPNTNANTKIYAVGNTIPDYTKYGTFSIAAAARGSKYIRIKDIDGTDYSVEPTLTNTYYGQVVHYNGYTYKNNGSSMLTIGIDALNNGVNKSYTAAGGGDYSLDLSTLPAGAFISSFIFEVKTTRGYYTPQIAQYYVYKIGNGLAITNILDTTDENLKISVSNTGTTLNVTFSGADESDSSKSKQIYYRTYPA